MPKQYDPAMKAFQPIEQALLKEVLDDTSPAPEPRLPRPVPRPSDTARKVVPLDQPQSPAAEPARGPEPAERLNAPLKVHLQPAERRELNRVLNQISQELGTSVSASHVQRALLTLLLHGEAEVLKRAREHAPMRRPPNDNLAAIAAFEFRLAKILYGGLRQAPPLREAPRE